MSAQQSQHVVGRNVYVALFCKDGFGECLIHPDERLPVYDAYARLIARMGTSSETYREANFDLVVVRCDPESGEEKSAETNKLFGYNAVVNRLEHLMRGRVETTNVNPPFKLLYSLCYVCEDDKSMNPVGGLKGFHPIYKIYAAFIIDQALVHHKKYTNFRLTTPTVLCACAQTHACETFTEMRGFLREFMDKYIV